MNYLIKITNDLFDVADRLKSVNENYVVYYNAKSARYEVHDASRQGGTLAFTVPYDELDCRAVEYARYTSVSRADRLFEEIERNNKKLAARD